MAEIALKLELPKKLSKEPVVYHLAHDFDLIVNITKGRFTESSAWVVAELEGTRQEIDRAIDYLNQKHVKITYENADKPHPKK
jgi:ABC-type methionine transport system ATPase subunit